MALTGGVSVRRREKLAVFNFIINYLSVALNYSIHLLLTINHQQAFSLLVYVKILKNFPNHLPTIKQYIHLKCRNLAMNIRGLERRSFFILSWINLWRERPICEHKIIEVNLFVMVEEQPQLFKGLMGVDVQL